LKTMVSTWTVREGPGWLLATDRAETFAVSEGVAIALGRPNAFDRDAGTFRAPSALARDLARLGPTVLRGIVAPFRAAWLDERTGVLRGETDDFGVGHVFLAGGDGFAALSSSATCLADLISAPRDLQTLAGYATFGTFLGDETPFEGVAKL